MSGILKLRSFSLIELMVIVAIVGILTGVALPSYKFYTIKSTIAKDVRLIESLMTQLKEHYALNGEFPNNIDVFGTTVSNSSLWIRVDAFQNALVPT